MPVGSGVDSAEVARRLAALHRRIEAAGGDPGRVAVVAVTKTFGPEAVVAAVEAGCTLVGENYAQELVAKATALAGDPRTEGRLHWQFLGAIQRNKVGSLAPHVACWQSVARLAEGEAIARRRPGAPVMVEVETTGRPGRNGCPAEGVPDLVRSLAAAGLTVRGLMTVATPDDPTAAFRITRRLADDLGLAERSMGMSDDLEPAVAEGSTMVRIGRGLFGERVR